MILCSQDLRRRSGKRSLSDEGKSKMIVTLFIIDEILCIISIFALAFFCAVLPKTGIAKYFYILFGITLIPIGIKFILDGEAWYVYIWVFLFAVVGIIVGIWLISLFAFVENMMYAMTWCMKRMRGTQEYRGTLYIAGALVYVLALAMHDSVRLVSWLGTCYVRYVVPVLVGIVLVSYILMKWREKKSLQGNETCGEENG